MKRIGYQGIFTHFIGALLLALQLAMVMLSHQLMVKEFM